MSSPTMICDCERRRQLARDEGFNGLDYLEVGEDQTSLHVYFLDKAPQSLTPAHFAIEGGQRIQGITVTDVDVTPSNHPDLDDVAVIRVSEPGDFTTYRLRIAALGDDRESAPQPLDGFDPRYSGLDFSFKVDCPSGLDCKHQDPCPPPTRSHPEINYLAKDYASFRQLMLDRLAVTMPEWSERHVPDIGIALVELFAYVGDHLSYQQDAVATEAYLETANQRVSVRRHGRLVDYHLHEGCNARAWVCLETSLRVDLDPGDTLFITEPAEMYADVGRVLHVDDLADTLASSYEVFMPMGAEHPDLVTLLPDHNRILFYTWGDEKCCLPVGTTSATLAEPPRPPVPGPGASSGTGKPTDSYQHPPDPPPVERGLELEPGDVLVFIEETGPKTGHPADADPNKRHAVRLIDARPSTDPVTGALVVEIEWHPEDALPFALCLSSVDDECQPLEHVSVACGNVVLVDHGRPESDPSSEVPHEPARPECTCGCCDEPASPTVGLLRPRLSRQNLTFATPLRPESPATAVIDQNPRHALPAVRVIEEHEDETIAVWTPAADLLGAGPSDPRFVVEVDNLGIAQLRFGDGELGSIPKPPSLFTPRYRVGNGRAGNVGAGAITRLVLRTTRISGVTLGVSNPLAARGGIEPETITAAKMFAPNAFRTDLLRAVVPADYVEIAERHPDVQRAAASLRWTGSWPEVLVGIDQVGSAEAKENLLDEVAGMLHRYRRIGHDVVVRPARHVPLLLAMGVCVEAGHLRGHVEADLLDRFSNRMLADGSRGFFQPDHLSFGEGIFLSAIVAAAQAVAGVKAIETVALSRLWSTASAAKQVAEEGVLRLGPMEIARLDNDASFPENGKLALTLEGGR